MVTKLLQVVTKLSQMVSELLPTLVKKEPTFWPFMIFRMVLYFIPLQITTPQPLSRAHRDDLTFDSMPPVPVNDFSPNLMSMNT